MSTKDPVKTAHRKSTRGEYIETDTGNKVSRRALITGTPHITLAGRVVVSPFAILRGDLVSPSSTSTSTTTTTTDKPSTTNRTSIAISRYTFLAPSCTLHPPHRTLRNGTISYLTLRIGENVYIGPGAFIAAAQIGSNVYIGAGAVVGNLCVLRDGCKVEEGAVLVEGMVVPAGVVVGGRPARVKGEVDDAFGVGNGEVWVEGGELRELVRGVR